MFVKVLILRSNLIFQKCRHLWLLMGKRDFTCTVAGRLEEMSEGGDSFPSLFCAGFSKPRRRIGRKLPLAITARPGDTQTRTRRQLQQLHFQTTEIGFFVQ